MINDTEFERAFRLVYQADDGFTWAVRITAESEKRAARQWFIDMAADDFAVEDTECLGHTVNELHRVDNCAIGSGRDVFLLNVIDITLPPVDSDDGVHHFEPGRYLTVGDLRALIEGLDDTVQVVIADSDWYQNVEGVALPETPENEGMHGWCALTLFPGVDEDYCFDARQV